VKTTIHSIVRIFKVSDIYLTSWSTSYVNSAPDFMVDELCEFGILHASDQSNNFVNCLKHISIAIY
jgi:hypothetical protein